MAHTLEQRLRELEHEELVRILLSVAASSTKLAKTITAETLPPKERITAIQRTIAKFAQLKNRRTR